MRVEIWSDVVCPWCYVGKRRFEAAMAAFAQRDEVEVVWRSFELDPSAPTEREGDYPTRLARKYGVDVVQAQAMIDRMVDAGAGDGLALRFDRSRPGNTFDAHRLLHLAAQHGVQDAVKERFLAATFTEGEPIGDRPTLVRLAAEAGLDAEAASETLASDAFADAVRADEREASRLGISGVPFFVVDGRYGVSGAQSPDVLLDVLERAWQERLPAIVTIGGDTAPGCDGDACDV